MTEPLAKDYLVAMVSFRPIGKAGYYRVDETFVQKGDAVIVEGRFGPQLGKVVSEPRQVRGDELSEPPPPIKGKATSDDVRHYTWLRWRAEKDLEIIRTKVSQHHLPMRLSGAEYTLDERLFIVYFWAEGRLDFRELVRDLQTTFPTRVRLHQVGARDSTAMMGGIGPCGRSLCCSMFLGNCPSISMKMAKDQGLPADPDLLTGLCGKLKCCLRYEHETYKQLLAYLPKVGQHVETSQGMGKVMEVNILEAKVKVALESGGWKTFRVSELAGYENPPFSSVCKSGGCGSGGCGGCQMKGGEAIS